MLQEASLCPPGDDVVYDEHSGEGSGSGEELDEEEFGSGGEAREYEYEATSNISRSLLTAAHLNCSCKYVWEPN